MGYACEYVKTLARSRHGLGQALTGDRREGYAVAAKALQEPRHWASGVQNAGARFIRDIDQAAPGVFDAGVASCGKTTEHALGVARVRSASCTPE